MNSVKLLLPVIATLFIVCGASGNDNDCDVTIQNGRIIGATEDTLSPEKKVCSYLGIPFAAPPVGELRFKPPVPAHPWTGTLNATKFANWCPQDAQPLAGIEMSEDCLYLNVYQPKIPSRNNASLPVMIWIHGGMFTGGSAYEYTPFRLLARGDVILVTIHYRLGILGFLSTGDEVCPGNMGMKDQSLAIKWANENIQKFGGNPNQVTIFGESAGSASVALQMLSHLNKGMIHGVIAQSGVALSSWVIDKNPRESSLIMAERLNCSTNNSSSKEMLACFREISWDKFVQLQTSYTFETFGNFRYSYAAMTPVVEVENEGVFLTEEPLEILKNNQEIADIPLMLGTTKHDGSFVLALYYLTGIGPKGLDKNPDFMRNELVPKMMEFFRNEEDEANRAVSSTVELAYLNGKNRSSWDESMPGLVDIATVFAFKSSVLNTAEILSGRNNNSNSKVFLYSFEHEGNNTRYAFDRDLIPVDGGIAHSDDLIYLFDMPSTFTERDRIFSEKMCDMWINFATFGEPTPFQDDRFEQWPAYKGDSQLYMKLNVTPTVQSDFLSTWITTN